MSPLKGVRVIEVVNSLVVPRGGRGGEERAWLLSFSFFQMKNFWSSVSRQRRRTEHYFKRVQTVNCALRVSYDITEATKTRRELCTSIGKRRGSAGGYRKVFIEHGRD